MTETIVRCRSAALAALAQAAALVALLLAAVPALAFAAEPKAGGRVPIWMGPSSQGSQLTMVKPVRSWKALKFEGMVRQQTDFSCGAAALATIFNYGFGRKTTEQQILVNMMKVSDPEVVREKGFSLLDMKNYVKAIGMTGEGFEVPFSALAELKVPAIALMNIKNYKHFVVIRKAGDDYIQVADPALGNRSLSRREFEKSWNGVVFVVLGEGFDPNSVLRNPPPPLSARRLFDQRSPVINAEATEFGFQTATSFSF
jgi:predicted double-glycine peptidase